MKRLFTLTMLTLLVAAGASAQNALRRTWDFREGFSAKTVNALKGDQEEFGDNKYWRNYEGDATKADEQHFWCASKDAKNADGYAATHNGGQEKVISELEGLTLGFTAAKKFVITYNGATYPNEFESDGGPAIGEPIPHGKSYIWLNGKNETIKFKAMMNQTIKIGVESHAVNRTKLGEARGISLSTSDGTLTLTKGNAVPTYYTECEWELTGAEGEVAELTIKSTNGCHIYYIIVGEGDDPNANKTQVGYITAADDATQEAAFQAIAADETYNVTPIAAATLTAEAMQGYSALVISPWLPADNSAVATLKEQLPFFPIVNLNAGLYAAWGYGQPEVGNMGGFVMNTKSELFSGFGDEDWTAEGDDYMVMLSGGDYNPVRLGDYFAGDEIVVMDGSGDSALVAVHTHNPYHNAYIYLPYTNDATAAAQKMLINAIEMAKGSKSEITQAPAPRIKLIYKNQNTNIELSMTSSSLPKPHIYYTLDGTEPTEKSQEYTGTINVTSETTVKAVAIAEGYLLSTVAEAKAEIFAQPATPVIATQFEEGKTIVTLTCSTEGADIWYNFDGIENDTAKSMKYAEPLTLALPANLTCYAVTGGQVYSEIAAKRVVVKNPVVRQDVIGLFDANAKEWQNGGGSTVYYFTWGKNSSSIYDTAAEPVSTSIDPETGDTLKVYPEVAYQTYVPAVDEEGYEPQWQVMSKGQVMIWQSLTAGADPGNDSGYNPETGADILPYAKITSNDIQFGGKTSGEPCTGAIRSLKKFQGPFDVVTHVGTAAGGDNVGRMQIEVSTDTINWTPVGDEMTTSKVKRLWKSYTRSYEGTDEVYVRITQVGGGASVQIYDMYILNQGEKSQALIEQYKEEFATGIKTVSQLKSTVPAGIYNLNGTRLNGMKRGLNIVVYGDGSVKKIVVK